MDVALTPLDPPKDTHRVCYYTYSEPHTPEDDVAGWPARDVPTDWVCDGAKTWASHDDAGRRKAFSDPHE